MKRKLIAAVLICSVMLSVFTVPSSALVSEALVLGSVVAAFASACGIAILSTGNTAEEVNQFFYDRFSSWMDREEDKLTAAEVLTGVAIQDGKLRIQSGISKLLSRFMPDLVQVNVASGLTSIEGIGSIPVYHINSTSIDYSGLTTEEQRDITLNFKNGTVYSPVYYKRSIRISSQGVGYYPYYNNTYQINTGAIRTTNTTVSDNKEYGYKLCIMILDNGSKEFGAIYPYRTKDSDRSFLLHFVGIQEAYLDLTYTKDIATGDIVSVPGTSIEDDEETIISIGSDVSDLSDLAEKVGDQAAAGTLTATYTIGNTVPPIPETNLSWVKSFHSIWEYVEYLINQAAAGFSFFGNLLEALPVEVEFCFYGALVLLLFGGVISRLLL